MIYLVQLDNAYKIGYTKDLNKRIKNLSGGKSGLCPYIFKRESSGDQTDRAGRDLSFMVGF